MKQLEKKIKLQSKITVITGLHIGGNSDNVEIGGIDNPVIKLAFSDNKPYIPGSSIKGKMRCLLEQVAGSTTVGGNSDINKLFGKTDKDDNKNLPSKIIVRDAMLTDESENTLRNSQNTDMPYTEGKWENVIDRVHGKAEHPRQTERVPAGAEFCAEFVINVWDEDNEQDLIAIFKKGIRLLENDYLGGSGSRGYGQIKFCDWKKAVLNEENKWEDELKPIEYDEI